MSVLRWSLLRAVVGSLAVCVALAACGSTAHRLSASGDATSRGELSGPTYITVWFRASASVDAEWQTMVRQVAEFNRSQRLVRVRWDGNGIRARARPSGGTHKGGVVDPGRTDIGSRGPEPQVLTHDPPQRSRAAEQSDLLARAERDLTGEAKRSAWSNFLVQG